MKYEFKGTDGQWKLSEMKDNGEHWIYSYNCSHLGDIICNPPTEDEELSRDMWRHNKHLIAAAPDLLDACIEALDLLDNLNKHGEPINYNEYSHYHDVLSSAIHKALNIQ